MLNSRSRYRAAYLPVRFDGQRNSGDFMRTPVFRRIALVAAAFALGILALPLTAHHANSAYDRTRTINVTGIVTRWQFINPHAGIWLEVTDEQGNVTEWSGEFQSIQDLYRYYSWNKDTFQPGDRITIVGNPDRRPDRHSMWTSKVVFADGTQVDVRNTPE